MDCNKNLEGEIILFWKWKGKNGLGKKNIGICKGKIGMRERKKWNMSGENGICQKKIGMCNEKMEHVPKKFTATNKIKQTLRKSHKVVSRNQRKNSQTYNIGIESARKNPQRKKRRVLDKSLHRDRKENKSAN